MIVFTIFSCICCYFFFLWVNCECKKDFFIDTLTNILHIQIAVWGQQTLFFSWIHREVKAGLQHFKEQLKLVSTFAQEIHIGPSNFQISVVSFSTRVTENFNLKWYPNKVDLINAIHRIPYLSGSTHTSEAINFALLHSFTPGAGDRPPVTDVLFVVTDGQSISPTNKKQAADLAHKAGIKTFAIGVGSSISKQELLNIASDSEHVFQAATFDTLHTLQS